MTAPRWQAPLQVRPKQPLNRLQLIGVSSGPAGEGSADRYTQMGVTLDERRSDRGVGFGFVVVSVVGLWTCDSKCLRIA